MTTNRRPLFQPRLESLEARCAPTWSGLFNSPIFGGIQTPVVHTTSSTTSGIFTPGVNAGFTPPHGIVYRPHQLDPGLPGTGHVSFSTGSSGTTTSQPLHLTPQGTFAGVVPGLNTLFG